MSQYRITQVSQQQQDEIIAFIEQLAQNENLKDRSPEDVIESIQAGNAFGVFADDQLIGTALIYKKSEKLVEFGSYGILREHRGYGWTKFLQSVLVGHFTDGFKKFYQEDAAIQTLPEVRISTDNLLVIKKNRAVGLPERPHEIIQNKFVFSLDNKSIAAAFTHLASLVGTTDNGVQFLLKNKNDQSIIVIPEQQAFWQNVFVTQNDQSLRNISARG
jgi:hypothetical protein